MVNAIYTGETEEMPKVLVELAGEFDASELALVSRKLDDASQLGLPVSVDLSGVTFLDTLCTAELVARSSLGGGCLRLCEFSWQAAASFRACGYAEQDFGREKNFPSILAAVS